MLGLAREIGALGDSADAVRVLAAAFMPDGRTPHAVYAGWIASRGDKTGALALAWAREQVRLALEDVIERDRRRGRVEAPAETLAWLVLAACESLAHEPPAAVADRVRALLALTGHAATDG